MQNKSHFRKPKLDERLSDLGLVKLRHAMPMSRRSFAKGALAAGAAAAIGLPTTTASAATEVKYMGWQGYDDGLMEHGWFEDNDIVLSPTYISSVEEITAAAISGGMGVLDLAVPGDIHMDIFEHAGILEPLDLGRIPNFQDVFPSIQKRFKQTDDGRVLAVPFMWGSLPLMYNADVIKEPPTSWMDQFKSEYTGKVGMIQELAGNMIWAVRAANDVRETAFATEEQLEKAADLLIKLKKEQALTMIPSYGDLATMFATGEIVIGTSWEPISVWAGPDAPTLKWVMPEEGCLTFVDTLAVIKDSPNLEACYKILDYSVSAEAQAATANMNGTASTVSTAVPLLNKENRALYPYDDIDGWMDRAGPFQAWPAVAGEGHVEFDRWAYHWERVLGA
jgi:spermidine/putrescine-binding protein